MPSPRHEPTSPRSNQHGWGFALQLGPDTGSGASPPASGLSAPHLSRTQADTGIAALHEPGQQVQPLAGEIGFKFCHSGKKRRKEGREGRREAGSVCGSWERKRSVPAGAGGDAQLTTSVLAPAT